MSRAVVEQAAPEHVPYSSPHKQLGLSSLLGALYVLFSLIFVFGLLPTMWDAMLEGWRQSRVQEAIASGISEETASRLPPVINEFLSGTLLLLLMIGSAVLLWYVGRRLERAHTQHGLRAGVFFGAVAFTLVLWLATKIGILMTTGDEINPISVGFVGAILGGLLFGVFWLFRQPGFGRWLGRVEDAGWFHAISYKGNQGVRVRRGTIVGLLAIGLCGVYSLASARMLGSSYRGTTDWLWEIPFTRDAPADAAASTYVYVPVMHKVPVVLPILLCAALLWFCWRVVNWPTFADCLIATEAEINKVSWTTRRRLVQDTIVVLVAVFLMTAFLFLVDILWIKILTHPWVSVLQVDIKSEFQKQQEKTQW
jgi:preprotein translocase SecE subunit